MPDVKKGWSALLFKVNRNLLVSSAFFPPPISRNRAPLKKLWHKKETSFPYRQMCVSWSSFFNPLFCENFIIRKRRWRKTAIYFSLLFFDTLTVTCPENPKQMRAASEPKTLYRKICHGCSTTRATLRVITNKGGTVFCVVASQMEQKSAGRMLREALALRQSFTQFCSLSTPVSPKRSMEQLWALIPLNEQPIEVIINFECKPLLCAQKNFYTSHKIRVRELLFAIVSANCQKS